MIGEIVRTSLRQRLAQPITLATWVVIPAMIGVLMAAIGFAGGRASSPTVTVLLVDPDGSVTGRLLDLAAGRQDNLLLASTTADAARQQLDDGRATAILYLPPGVDRALLDAAPVTLDLVLNPSQRILPDIVTALTDIALDAAWYARRLLAEPIEGLRDRETVTLIDLAVLLPPIQRLTDTHLPPPLTLEVAEAAVDARQPARVRYGATIVPGLVAMMLLFAAGGLADDLWIERDAGTLRRFLASPHAIGTLIAGKLIAAGVIMAAMAAIGLGLGWAIARQSLAGTLLALMLMTLMGVTFCALYMTIQMFAASRRTASLLTNLVMFPLLMVGGSFFPLDQLPGLIGTVGRWTPNGRTVALAESAMRGHVEPTAIAAALALLVLLSVPAVALLARRLQQRGAEG